MKKEERVYAVFERVAEGYDAANRRISLGQHGRWKRAAVRQLLAHVPERAVVLDLGCGTGDMLALLRDERPGLELIGLDFSPAMLRVAERRLRGDAHLRLLRGDAMALPFDDGSLDGAVIAFALRNTADCDAVLRGLRRALKPGAPLVCIDSFTPERAWVRPFYRLYFAHLMPLLGGGLRLREDYRWLSESTESFLSPTELCRHMEGCGLHPVEVKRFLMGSCVSVCALNECEE